MMEWQWFDIEKHNAWGALSQGLAKGRSLTRSSATVHLLDAAANWIILFKPRPFRVKTSQVEEVSSLCAYSVLRTHATLVFACEKGQRHFGRLRRRVVISSY